MNKITILLLASILIGFTACSSRKQSRNEEVAEFRSQLTIEDTTTMLKLCDDAMEALKAKNIDKVLASLCEYTDSTKEVKPLSKETAQRYRRQFTMFPVLSYERKYYSFQLEGCNDVKYEVVFATAEQAGTDQPAKTAYMFNPVKIDGQWRLCVKTADEEIDKTMH
ncbi:hypothetical protein [Prevotella sp.]|uniref:hypothetical protein n=1 Tax=Prevotella sp. TaxID=59823 RepID=UPI004024AFC0